MKTLLFICLMAITSVTYAKHWDHDDDHHGHHNYRHWDHGYQGKYYDRRFYGSQSGIYFSNDGITFGININPNAEPYDEEPYYIYDNYGNRVLVYPRHHR